MQAQTAVLVNLNAPAWDRQYGSTRIDSTARLGSTVRLDSRSARRYAYGQHLLGELVDLEVGQRNAALLAGVQLIERLHGLEKGGGGHLGSVGVAEAATAA